MSTVDSAAHVARQIEAGNDWYTSSQFEWARQPGVWRIYAGRERFFAECIKCQRLRSPDPLRVLDAGCGDGYWLSRLSRLPGMRLTGVDYNPLRVARAKQAAPGARVLVGDLTALAPGEVFDVILFSQVIEHVVDDVGLLRSLRRFVDPKGCLILGTPNEGSPRHQRTIQELGSSFKTDHVHFYTESEITGKIGDAGFTIDRVYREVFHIGNDRLYYGLNARVWGFALLTFMTRLYPSECSDFYFECRPTVA